MDFLASTKEVCQRYYSEKRMSNKLGVKCLPDDDIDTCNYVLNKLSMFDDTDFGKQNITAFNLYLFKGNEISFETLKEQSIEEFKKFDDDVYIRISSMSTKFFYFTSFMGDLFYSANVGFSVGKIRRNIDINSGEVYSIVRPNKYYELSVYLLAHEYIHSLKDTNYNEFVNAFITGETLPIFYELISSEDNLGDQLLKFRLKNTMAIKKDFSEVNLLIDNSGFWDKKLGNYSLYKYYRSICGVYLNSFYYAIILYNMYKQSPKQILDMVSKILKQEMTTLEMLEQLGIYRDINDSIFEGELRDIKRLIK